MILGLVATVALAAEPELVLVRGPWPTLPAGAAKGAPVTCDVAVQLQREGTAGAVQAACPEPFAGAAETAARGWAWSRPDGGDPDGLKRTLRFRFGGPGAPVAGEDAVALPLAAWALPPYPRHAPGAFTGGDERCEVELAIGADGAVVPGSARISRCEGPFVQATTDAVTAWRWSVPAGIRYPVATRFGVAFHGREPEPGSAPLTSRAETVAALPIEVVHQVPPTIPPAARALGPGKVVRCEVDVVLKGSGAPATATPVACPPELADAVVEAVRKWRWARTTPDAPPLAGLATRVAVSVRIP